MSPKFNLLFSLDQLNIGGKEKRLLMLLKNLNRKKYNLSLINFGNGELLIEYKKSVDKIFSLKRSIRWDPFLFLKIKKLIFINKPDLIISFDWMTSFYLRRIAKIHNITFINASISDANRKISLRKLIKKYDLHRSDYVIANSQAGLKAYGLSASEKNIVINNGIKIQKRINEYNVQNIINIGIIGNLTYTRNYPLIFKSLSILKQNKHAFHLFIVGDGPRKKEFIKILQKNNLIENVTFLGLKKNVHEIISLFDIGIHASYQKIGEGFSNAIMEYMANAKPVVATSIGGTKEFIKHGKGGYLISNNNEVAFADALENLLLDRSLRIKMGNYNYEYVVNNLLLDKMVSKYDKFFDQLLYK